jgi:beta-galactosidase
MKEAPFILGTQYFRPPFPKSRYWAEDIKAMRGAGLNAVQLWLVWGWCEPEPGKFRFEDYDRIAELAARQEMGVVLSTLPEINPFWLPRIIPDGLMVDIEGRPVLNCNRWETISGLVPGLCSDHPEVRKRMVGFLEACARHFGPWQRLLAWDCWNENRWRNMAPEAVCFCDHSLESLRGFLREKYGGLDALGQAWGRRYATWEDVRIGRLYSYSYPEWHDYTLWLCRRAQEMARWRTEALKRGDPVHPVSNHTGNPSLFGGTNVNENIFTRGIDWDIAPGETYGYSSFPKAGGRPMSPEEFCMRTSALTSVGKPIWMSELQGGPTAIGRNWGPPLSGAEQQTWIWTGLSRGAKAVLFWCWRPEVFGVESNGFGFAGDDGLYPDRAAAMRRTAGVLRRKAAEMRAYRADAPETAVLFQRSGYFLGWMNRQFYAQPLNDTGRNTEAYLTVLERTNTPYTVLDDRHLPARPGALKLIIVPDPLGLDDAAAEWLVRFARAGGTVFIEGGAGMHGADTFYRYPGERPFYKAAGLAEDLARAVTRDRRTLPAGALGNAAPFDILLDKVEMTFKPRGKGVVALYPDSLPMLANKSVGKGRIVALGSVVGRRMLAEDYPALETLLLSLTGLAGIARPVTAGAAGAGFLTWRLGRAGRKRLLFLCNYGGRKQVRLRLAGFASAADWFDHPLAAAREGKELRLSLALAEYDYAVLELK